VVDPGANVNSTGAFLPPTMVPRPKWFTVRQVAEQLQVWEITVYRAIYSGRLKSARIGRCVRIPWESLQEYLFRPRVVARQTKLRANRASRRAFPRAKRA